MHDSLSSFGFDRHFVTELEDYFRTTLHNCRIYELDDDSGCFGVSAGSDIRLSRSLRDYPDSVRRLVLAHEAAHVVQQRTVPRHGAQSSSLGQMEFEASAAAVAWSLGQPCPELSATHAGPHYWGPEGHYYTVYLLALLCGIGPSNAFQLAFYAQLPDQVIDLDATVAGERYVAKNAFFLFPAHRSALPGGPPQSFIDIQAALHCLTGRNGGEETALREKILAGLGDIATSQLEYGLALHALGDSFAHRQGDSDDASMFSAPYGHLTQGKAVTAYVADRISAGLPEDLVKLGAEVDEINRRPEMYRRYVESMRKVLASKTGRSPDAAALKALVTLIISKAGEAQRDLLIGTIRKVGGLNPYTPEEKPMSWEAFARRHSGLVSHGIERRAGDLLDRWRVPNRNPFPELTPWSNRLPRRPTDR